MAGIPILDLQRCHHRHDSLLSGAYEYGDANRGLKYTTISRTILSDETGTAVPAMGTPADGLGIWQARHQVGA
jgi:hypothetical protein